MSEPRHFLMRVLDLIFDIVYKNYDILVDEDPASGRVYLQVQAWLDDVNTGNRTLQHGGKVYLSEHMVDSEIVRKAFQAVLAFEEHEARENFEFRGKRIFGPHIDVEALARVADIIEVREAVSA